VLAQQAERQLLRHPSIDDLRSVVPCCELCVTQSDHLATGMPRLRALIFPDLPDLLGVAPLRLWWWAKTGQFVRESDVAAGRPWWSRDAVCRWAAASPFGLAGRVPLRYWPDAIEPAEYDGAFQSSHAVSLRWSTRWASVLMVWTLPDSFVGPLAELITVRGGRTFRGCSGTPRRTGRVGYVCPI
jgi:hypothetical protein